MVGVKSLPRDGGNGSGDAADVPCITEIHGPKSEGTHFESSRRSQKTVSAQGGLGFWSRLHSADNSVSRYKDSAEVIGKDFNNGMTIKKKQETKEILL